MTLPVGGPSLWPAQQESCIVSCLGGTAEEPRVWVRYYSDGRTEEVDGRICTGYRKASAHTSRRLCAACPAFRGLRWDGTVSNGLSVDGLTPFGLSRDEAARYEAAIEAQQFDGDDEPLFVWYGRQDRELVTNSDGTHRVFVGIGERGLRRIGDPDAVDRYAALRREWRAAHPGEDKRQRGHRDRAAYMREYRKRKKGET